jgi:NAD(P)-dependent dehydrogenase (short-subunit alcohol dehydrogenase family)
MAGVASTMLTPDLSDRTVLVTGSAKGVGRQLALAAARCGARAAVHYRTSGDAAREVAAEAEERGAADTTVVQGDVTDETSVDGMFDAVEADLGSVDVLVNNVGAFAPRHWSDIDPETWHRVLDTNLTATYLTCRRALPAMRDAGWGRIVNVGYASADEGLVNPKNFPYFAAKAGVLMFTRMLAADTQDDGVTANAISPYVVENSDEFPDDLPRGRPASFDDLAHAVLFFLHEDSDYLSGVNVEVDGGWLPESV